MWCGKCGGRVFIDRMFQGSKKSKKDNQESNHLELFCVMCGKRWMLDKTRNRLASCLAEKERALASGYGTSTSK